MGRSYSYRINLKLHPERDADLIAWIESQERGQRSAVIREALQYGAGLRRPPEEIIAQMVRQAVADALDGLRLLVAEQGAALEPNNIEEQFGAQLDDLLDRFG
jgi:Arc/MetJ-type ribon-helix-helix transcriptional regulator